MKKRILSVLLVIALLVTVGIVSAQAKNPGQAVIDAAAELSFPTYTAAEIAAGVTENGDAIVANDTPRVSAVCPICGTSQSWRPIIGSGNINGGGTKHFYVAVEELNITSKIYSGSSAKTHIVLNGATINANTDSGAFYSDTSSQFAIMGDGNVINTNAGTTASALYSRGGNLDVYGGNYSTTGANSAALLANIGSRTINIYGGTIASDAGVAVKLSSDETINIYSGTVSGVVQATAGNLNVNGASVDGNVTVNGASAIVMSGNVDTITVETGSLNVSGGEIETLNATEGSLAISGGTITTATVTGANVSLSGSPKITNLDLTGATTLPITVSALTEGADIGVKVADGTTVATGLTAEAAKYFSFVGNALYDLTVDASGNLVPAEKTFETAEEIMDYANNHMDFSVSTSQYCPVCKATVSWSKLSSSTGANLNGGGTDPKHYYLDSAGVETTNYFKNGSGSRTTHIHLNNSSLTVTNTDYAFSDYGHYVLMGQGNVTQAGTGTVLKSGGSTMKIYGGTYTATDSASYALQIRSGSTWDIYGGTFNGGVVTMGVTSSAGILNVHDADFNSLTSVGTTAIAGGEITNLSATGGSLTIGGGTITKATVTGANLTLSGKPSITTLDLTGATKLPATITNLDSKAKIGLKVSGDTVIAENLTADQAKCFTCDDPNYKMSVDENGDLVVAMRDFASIDDVVDYAENYMFFGYEGGNVTAFCPVCQATVSWAPRDAAYGLNINGGGNKHLYIAQETWSTSGKIYTGSGSTHLNLNGATITANHDSGVFYSQSSDTSFGDGGFSVMGAGTVIQNGSGYVFFVNNSGYLNVYGGNYTNANGKIFYSQSENATLTVGGGTFNGDSTFSEGNLNILGGFDGKIKMNGVGGASASYADDATINCDVDGVVIDVYGRANVTVGGTGAVKIMDSKNMETVNAAVSSYGKVIVNNPNAVAADNYIQLSERSGKVSFHYYSAKVSGVSLKPGSEKIGMYFNGTWTLDSVLRKIADVGIVVSTKEQPTETFFENYLNAQAGDHKFYFYSYSASDVPNGTSKTGVLVNGIMKNPADPARYEINSNNGLNGKLYSAAYVMIPSETEDEADCILKVSAPVEGKTTQTVYSVLNLFDDNETAFTANKDALTALYTKWQNSMATWAFDRIGVKEQ